MSLDIVNGKVSEEETLEDCARMRGESPARRGRKPFESFIFVQMRD